MRQRCNNPNNPKYGSYGRKGIKVCSEWDSNFQAFKGWALKNGYQDPPKDADSKYVFNDALTLDRVDGTVGYCPENCRWVPFKQNRTDRRFKKRESFVFKELNTRLIFERLERLCKERGITISGLEKACGFGNGTVRGWKNSDPSVGKVKRVADFFGCTIDALVSKGE